MARTCSSSFGQLHVQTTSFCSEVARARAACWTALWHWMHFAMREGCEGHGSANGLPQPRMELAEKK